MSQIHESPLTSPAVQIFAPGGENVVAEEPRRNQGRAWTAATMFAAGFLIIVAVAAVIAPLIWPDVAEQQAGDILAANQGPSAQHMLGTDTVGRDVMLRLLVGTRPTMVGVLEGLFFVALLGIPVGVAAGYFRGWLDKVVSWMADIAFSIPAIVLIITVLAVFPGNMLAAMATFGVLAAPGLMRVVRSITLQVREELYISASQVAGLGSVYILTRHVLPRIRGALAVQASLLAGAALLVQTGLAFLGLVSAPPAPSWGGMVADGASVLALNSWLIWPPGIVISLTVLSFGVLSDSVRTKTGGFTGSTHQVQAMMRRTAPSTLTPVPRTDVLSAPTEGALVVIRGLKVSAAPPTDATRIVDSVSFSIRSGETVGLVGESGCGKSVTAAALMGILPSNLFVEEGIIEFDGVDLSTAGSRQLRELRGREIGFIGQEPMIGLTPTMRVGNQLAELIKLHHQCSRKEASRRAVELLASVKLPDPASIAKKFPHELSGGMAQRVSIARALTGNPRLLIADEPTTALDVTVQAEILDLLQETQQRLGTAILLITHDWGVVANVCDRAVVMYAGEVIEENKIDGIFARPTHPYTSLLLASNPHLARGAATLPTISGIVPPPGTWPTGCRFADRCPSVQSDCRAQPVALVRVNKGPAVRCLHPLPGASS